MTAEPFDANTTIIVKKIASGDRMALDELVHRYNWKMVNTASRYMQRLRFRTATCDAEDAVNDTLAKLYQRAVDGELPSVDSSIEFWRMFFSMLKEDLALIHLEIEEFLRHLADPINRRIAILKLESYTNEQIAELLEHNERTIERRLAVIRKQFLRYQKGS
jgi:DNA-directed RNA polymerase specialized sigma24 family protein